MRNIPLLTKAQKEELATKIESILKELNHPELTRNVIPFSLRVYGDDAFSWCDISERDQPN